MTTTDERDREIAALWSEYQQPILRYLRRILHQPELAEDICQETFLRALRGWDQHDRQANAAHWLYRIARNAAFDVLRRQRKITFTPPLSEDAMAVDVRLDTLMGERDHLRQALAQLPATYRDVLLLYSYNGYKVDEVAALLGCSPNTIKTRLVRGRERFRAAYERVTLMPVAAPPPLPAA